MTDVKKFFVLTVKGDRRKTHAAKGDKTSNRSWCGCSFKRTQIIGKREATIEHVTCQKCVYTISKYVDSLI